ncbi:MAG: TetR/AcrR family transcriptional regulator [Crocinitomicaceae bacterium]
MESKKEEIIQGALNVYMKFGIKSVTMDEMARQLGVSKKTLYRYVSDKNELVEACVLHDHECALNGIQDIMSKDLNAIEELLEIGRYMVKTLGSIHPSIFFDLSRYHPGVLKLMQTHKHETMRGIVLSNLTRGVKEGVYRENLSPDIMSWMHMGIMDMVMSGDVIPIDQYRVDEVYSEFFRYHIRGIASKKGLEHLKELVRKDENL